MSRLSTVEPEQATGKTKELLETVEKKLGKTINMSKAMAVSPAVLEGYLGLSGALSAGELDPAVGEQIAVGVAETNECGYCLSAHTYLGENVAGLSGEELEENRHFESSEPHTQAVLQLARAITDTRGGVSEADLDAARQAGLSDAQIAEVAAHVALNVLTNYFNRLAVPDVDFPLVELHQHSH